MAKANERAIKIFAKFLKNAEKDRERARSLIDKCKAPESGSALADLSDRLKQKELQASGDIVWAGQQIELARAARKADKKSVKKSKDKKPAVAA